jgi:NADPH:quinone reductase-like Zn-dependent oxidoreductase
MNAALVESFDKPPRYGVFAEPVAGAGEKVVTVSAVGLHPIVKSLARGKHYGSTGELPFVPGLDGVGRLEDGTRVYFGAPRSPFGSFAERTLTRESLYLRIPEELDDVTVAAMMNPGMSSWAALTERIQLARGEGVLILGATGVAGRMAVQIAKRLGASRVVAVGRNLDGLKETKQLGADAVIPLEQDGEKLIAAFQSEFAENRISVVLDYLWGNPAELLLEAIAQKGLQHAPGRIRYLQIGSTAGPTISLPAATLRSSGLEIYGSGFGSVSIERIFQSLAEFLKEAVSKPFVIETKAVPLRDIERLWDEAQSGTRIVFQP